MEKYLEKHYGTPESGRAEVAVKHLVLERRKILSPDDDVWLPGEELQTKNCRKEEENDHHETPTWEVEN